VGKFKLDTVIYLMINLKSEKIFISPLISKDINSEYLNNLNDSEYMQFSRHHISKYDFNKQKKYLETFNSFNSWILGVREQIDSPLIGTLTLLFDFRKFTVNIEFLVFKAYSGKGFATHTLKTVLEFIELNYPDFTLIIETQTANKSMKNVALKNGFSLEKEFNSKGVSYQKYTKNILSHTFNYQPKIPELLKYADSIGIAVNDAGGAEQVRSLISRIDKTFFILCSGPAKKIINQVQNNYRYVNSHLELRNCDLIITGSGWMSELENDVLRFCDSNNIPSLTILDHWINYRSRFFRGETATPSMLAVTNHVALDLAKEEYPKKPIWLLPDYHLESFLEYINLKNHKNNILILLEPNTNSSENFTVNLSKVIDLIEIACQMKELGKFENVVIRNHPSGNYDQTIIDRLKLKYSYLYLSKNSDLKEDIQSARRVLGFNTYGLYISAMCGVETQSYYAGVTGHWTSYFPKIKPLNLG